VGATYKRNGTIRAAPVAALRNLKVSVSAGIFLQAGSKPRGGSAQIAEQRIEVTGAKPRIHFGDEGGHLRLVTLRQAAEYYKIRDISPALSPDSVKDGLDRFFLGIPDKAAGIIKQVVERWLLHNTEIICRQCREQMFRIYAVL
jgi:hypothetical protein